MTLRLIFSCSLNRCSALLFAIDDFTEIQERLKREKQLKENQSRLQQTITDLSSSVRSQRTALAKLLALLQLPVIEDDAVLVDASFDAIEVRVKELLAIAESEVVSCCGLYDRGANTSRAID